MNILFAADRGYRDHIFFCIQSFLRFPVEEGYDIFLLHSDWTEEDRRELEEGTGNHGRVHFIYVDPELFAAFPENPRYPKLIYYRIFAAQLLPQDLERILYLDGDTIVINSLRELYDTEFGTAWYGACTHVRKFLTKVNQHRLGMEEEYSYINSGVLLMNLKELRKNQNIKEVLAYAKQRKAYLTLPDQDIITALYGSKTILLDAMKYNLSDRLLLFYNAAPANKNVDLDWVRKNAVIIHYYGKNKPWNSRYKGKLDVFYRELSDMICKLPEIRKKE